MRTLFLSVLFLASLLSSQAQIEGDNLFETPQITTFELTFSQVNFWDSLEVNYETSTYMMADLTLTDLTGTYTFADVGVRLKGNSSYSHPGDKKSFKIDFNRYVVGQDYDGLKKLNFSNGFKDPSCIREKIFFDVSRAAGVPAPRANFANVLMNGEAWGFYTLIEQIDDQFLDWKIGDDDGNLFKAGANFGGMGGGGNNAADLAYYGDAQSDYEERYELKTNEVLNDWTDLLELIDFINNSTDTEFENELADHLELQDYLRSAALDNAFSNLDSYTGSARNWYIYHNLTSNKWEWIKWDGNESFGTYSQGGGNMTTLALDYHDSTRPLLENIFDSPVLYAQYLDEVCTVVEEWFNPDYMNALIDDMKALVQDAVYADDNKMYSDADFDNNIDNNVGQAYGLKSFVSSKHNFLTGQLDCTVSVNLLESQPSFKLFPIPAEDVIYLSSLPEEASDILVFDALGRSVIETNSNHQSQVQLMISDLNPGNYVVIVRTNSSVTKKQFVKF